MSFLNKIESAQSFTGSSRPKLVAGSYNVKITEASYGANQTKTGYRGVVKVEVVDGDFATGLTNVYLSEAKNEDQTASNTKPFVEILAAAGGNVAKVEQDAETWADVHGNIMALYTRILRNGGTISARLVIKDSGTPDKPYRKLYAPSVEEAVAPLDMPKATAAEQEAFAKA